MNALEAIEQRKSRRSYLGTLIENKKLNAIQSLIDEYNDKANLSILSTPD